MTPQRSDEPVIVPLPPLGTQLWVLAIYGVLIAGLLGGAVAVAVMAPWGQGSVSPSWFIGVLAGCGLVLAAVVRPHLRRTLVSRRMRRESRDLLERCEAGRERVTGAALAAAVLAVEGCRSTRPVRLRRSRYDLWESRLRTRLPRVIIEEGPTVGALREMAASPPEGANAEPGGDRSHHWAHPEGVPWRDVLASVAAVLVLGALVLVGGYFAGYSVKGGYTLLAVKLFGGLVAGVLVWCARAVIGQWGWVLTIDRGSPVLRRTDRRGRELSGWPLDRRETLVVITDAAGRTSITGEKIGRVAWRFIPPDGGRRFELWDSDPRLLPWGPAVIEAAQRHGGGGGGGSGCARDSAHASRPAAVTATLGA